MNSRRSTDDRSRQPTLNDRTSITYETPYLFVNGERLGAAGRTKLAVINPATGERLGDVPCAAREDIDRALAAAEKGFAEWRKVIPYERAKILRRASAILRERTDRIASLITLEEGKPLTEARLEVNAAIDVIEWDAEEGRRIYGRVIPARARGSRYLAFREPVGPVAAFTPWNFPVAFVNRKLSAALATGCSIIIKPAEQTPASSLALAQAYADAGVPSGVINVVYGDPPVVSRHLINSPVIRKVSFTGSVETGKQVARMAADGLKRVTMELGGHAPVIILDDADIDQAVTLSIAAKFRNAGQMYMAPTRFYIHVSVYDRFISAFAGSAERLKVGDGLDAGVQMGPLLSAIRLEAMERFVDDAVRRGAKLVSGGRRIGERGNFWAPTVLADLPPDSLVMTHEPLGPLAAMVPFQSLEEVVASANGLPYGLASYVFTRSAKVAADLTDALESGMVGINTFVLGPPETPFGGVKESGYESEGGIEGLLAYTVPKFVNHQT